MSLSSFRAMSKSRSASSHFDSQDQASPRRLLVFQVFLQAAPSLQQLDGLAAIGAAAAPVLLLEIGPAPARVGHRVFRVALDGLALVLDGLVPVAQLPLELRRLVPSLHVVLAVLRHVEPRVPLLL